ncbi:hypothetical protein [Herpetosiphon geysericola]|uniref:Uncharacterized protein n=1 Tax=Herpetosiphon geysericola TaxID=70996 RepID=A0A0P6YCV6_9CHLR|nr:hypothetical protein [Herpetosiphon geysericola]KPL91231.1 hypothetical protein SE18_03570 [Herpetosiphon geysericola]
MFKPKPQLKLSKQGINAVLLIGGIGASLLLIPTLIITLSTKELDTFLGWFNFIGFVVLLVSIRLVLRRPGMYELPPPPAMPTNVDPSQGYYVPPAYVNESPGPFAHGRGMSSIPPMRTTLRGKFALAGTFILGFIIMLGLMAILSRTTNLNNDAFTTILILGMVGVAIAAPNILRLPGMRKPRQ